MFSENKVEDLVAGIYQERTRWLLVNIKIGRFFVEEIPDGGAGRQRQLSKQIGHVKVRSW